MIINESWRQSRYVSCYLKSAGMLFLVAICCSVVAGCKAQRPFDSSAWKKATGERAESRKKMLPALRSQHRLVGMSKDQIVDLLGEPDITGRFSRDEGNRDMNYYLGPEGNPYFSLLRIDSDWLTLKLKDGRVEDVSVTTD